MKYLSETPEFRQWVEKRKRAAEQRKYWWPLRVLHAALDGYLSELDNMLAAPVRLAPWR